MAGIMVIPGSLAALALAAFALSGQEPALDGREIARRIDAYVAPYDAIGHVSGNLLVALGDEIVLERSYGMANAEHGVSNRPETRFNVASISKPMTVVVLIRHAEARKLSLEDNLSKYLPDFPNGDAITIGHLARHRAGIPHRVTEEHEETLPRTAAEMVEFAKRKPLLFAPGARHLYSSGGFSVLARVLEIAGGETYGELLRRHVCEPIGLARTSHCDSREIVPDRAAPYLFAADGTLANAPLQDLSFLVGAGSVSSTARDLFALLSAVRAGRLGEGVKQSNVDENGIDWNGSTNGFRAFADWHAMTNVSVVFTGNLVTGALDRFRRDLPRVAAGEDVPAAAPPKLAPVPAEPAALERCEGVYEMREGTRLTVRAEGGGLRVNSWMLIPIGERTFFSPQDYATVEAVFAKDGDPRPGRLDWKMESATMACPRVGDL